MAWTDLVNQYVNELKEKISEIKGISDLEKKGKEIDFVKRVWGKEDEGKLYELKKSAPTKNSLSYLEEYEELLKELDVLDTKVTKKINQERKKTKSKPNNEKETSSKKTKGKEYVCDECGDIKRGEYFYHKSKNDQQKFCSNHCFLQHYAETCDNCLEKCLKYSGKKSHWSSRYLLLWP